MRRFRRWDHVERVGALLIALGYLLATVMPLGLALIIMGFGFVVVVVGVVGRHVRWPTKHEGDDRDAG